MQLPGERCFLLALLLAAGPTLTQASALPTRCDQYLSGRPHGVFSELVLKAGEWIPSAPAGKIYLPVLPTTAQSSVLRYKLVSSNLEIRRRADGSLENALPTLPAGYKAQFKFAIDSFPIVNVYEIQVMHPFPKAGQETRAFSPEESKIVMDEINRVSTSLLISLNTEGSRGETVTQLQRDIGTSRLIATQLYDENYKFAAFLYNSRETMKRRLDGIRNFLLNRLPLKAYLPKNLWGSDESPEMGY